jgi:poly(3-hydroxyalkanoate) synthetase
MYWYFKEIPDISMSVARYSLAWVTAFDHYRHDFESAYFTAAKTALAASAERPLSVVDSMHLYRRKLELAEQAYRASIEKMLDFHTEQAFDGYQAWINTMFGLEGEKLIEFAEREASVMEGVAYDFPKAIEDIKHEFGFQFHTDDYRLVMETDCFRLYQVLPIKGGVSVDNTTKPILLIPPYMLGVHILAFLPAEGKSYAHSFANRGIPTYVRVVKDIDNTPAVQTMTCEDDCEQTRQMCEWIKGKHNLLLSLNGVCQGGYVSLLNMLSGQLKGLVDTLITVVTPVDGTQSKTMGNYVRSLPADLSTHYAYDTLPNGNRVVNGQVMSLGFKFLALSKEAPLVAMYNMKFLHKGTDGNPGKTAAAVNRWLRHERAHLPISITEMSAQTYKTPIADDGTLPVTLFDQPLNLHDLKALGVAWYVAYSIGDDLVDPDSVLTVLDHLQDDDVLEITAFPGGHVSILTSHSAEHSKYPLDGEFDGLRGPIKFHMSRGEN